VIKKIGRLFSTNHPTEEPLSLAGFPTAPPLSKNNRCCGVLIAGEDTLVFPASVLREPD